MADRKHGWQRERPPPEPVPRNPDEEEGLEPWEAYDWDWPGFCTCGREDCRECTAQGTWWAALSPHLPFEAEGLVHITEFATSDAMCASAWLSKRFDNYNQQQVFATVARERHKVVTCFECTRWLFDCRCEACVSPC